VIKLEIPRVPLALNEMLRIGWRHRHRHNKLWNKEVFYALHQAGYMQSRTPYAKARVTIDRGGRREMDFDNLIGTVKPVVDALRYAHVLVDDSPKHLELIVTQSIRYQHPRTSIVVEPLT
jgi:hypothetical protein